MKVTRAVWPSRWVTNPSPGRFFSILSDAALELVRNDKDSSRTRGLSSQREPRLRNSCILSTLQSAAGHEYFTAGQAG